MPLERVRSETMTGALRRAQELFGDEAVVLGCDAVPGGVELRLEVTARPAPAAPGRVEVRPAPSALRASGATRPGRPPAAASELGAEVAALRAELAALQGELGRRAAQGSPWGPNATRPTPLERRLREQGLSPQLRAEAQHGGGRANDAAAWASAAAALGGALDDARTGADDVRALRRVALVGPTGVGKTTTAAKLAARALRRGESVAFVACDGERAGAELQLRVLAGQLGRLFQLPGGQVPVEVAHDAASLRAALDRLVTSDLVLLDTAGGSLGDPERTDTLRALLDGAPEVARVLVLAAPTELGSQQAAARQFARLAPRGVCLTKLDECARFGPLLELTRGLRLPLAWLGTGTYLRDLEVGGPAPLVTRLLGAPPAAPEVAPIAHPRPALALASVTHG